MPFTLIKGTFQVVGYQPDGDSMPPGGQSGTSVRLTVEPEELIFQEKA